MKPLLIFLFCVTVLISNNIPTSLCQSDEQQYTTCSNAFICGNSNITNLKYPFWGGNREKYCGNSQWEELTCEDSVPKISINSIKYRILGWDNTTYNLTLARDDYWASNNVCVDDPKNNTFDNTPFIYDAAVFVNVTLLYGCPSNPTVPSTPFSTKCGDGRTVYYYVGNPIQNSSCTIVVLPIRSNASLDTPSRIYEALNNGFGLIWRGNYDECKKCTDSGGQCGSDGQFQCFCKDESHSTSCSVSDTGKSSSSKAGVAIGTGVGGIVALVGLIGCVFFFMQRKRKIAEKSKSQDLFMPPSSGEAYTSTTNTFESNMEVFMQSYGSLAPKRYSFLEVKRVTNSFRDKLGQGGYGVVYKAKLLDDRLVAVKVISESKGSGEEFINEVASISRTSHVNIVSLLGFCYEQEKKALIYEFMPNGSLDKFIYKSGSPNAICDLDWHTLYQIAIGIARGLEYLHRGCSTRILHLDIKPQNILLDEDFCPKISDFGLAKICQKKGSIVSLLGTRGTIGYIAPEVFSRTFGGVSHKSDVYSYGMLILEMIGGRRNYDSGGSHSSEMYFPDWIYKDLEQGDIPAHCVVATEEENEKVMKMTLVSLWCVQINPSDRPSMSKVVEMLEGPLGSVSYPPKPVLSSLAMPPLQISHVSSSNIEETNSIVTQKDASIQLNELSKSIM